MIRFSIGALLVAAAVTLGASAASIGGGGGSSDTTLAAAPPWARARANPYLGNPSGIQAGEKLYRRHCASCHGADATGTRRAPSLRTPAVREAAPGEIEWFLRNGSTRSGMPSWSGLPEERRWQIVAYLQTLR